MYLSDLKQLDEANEVLTVYAMMSISWEDLRWQTASIQKVGPGFGFGTDCSCFRKVFLGGHSFERQHL